MTPSMRVVVTGLIAQYPVGGVTWDYFQYVLGLHRMGLDVYYLEDSGQWPYNPEEVGGGHSCDYNVRYLADVMTRFGLADRWAYHFRGGELPDGTVLEPAWFGLSEAKRREVLASADLLINVSSGLGNLEGYPPIRRLAFLDSDPVFTQIRLVQGDERFRTLVDAHDVHFSFGECHSEATPRTAHRWLPTRQPITLSEWRPRPSERRVFTTIMNWSSYPPIEHEGRTYGHKDIEFQKFLELPGRVDGASLEVALSAGEAHRMSTDFLSMRGWRVREAASVSDSLDNYRDYIESSMAEWSIAKNGYVEGRPGWFSCRSACYLAAGKPVVVQETGFSCVLPTGEGLLAFETLEEAADAVREVQENYERHASAARRIAEEYFDASDVLARLIEDAASSSRPARRAAEAAARPATDRAQASRTRAVQT